MGRATRATGGDRAPMARRPREAVLRELLGGCAGWSPLARETRCVRVLGRQYYLTPVAERGAWCVQLCEWRGSPRLPGYAARRLLLQGAAGAVLTVFTDGAATRQVWGWRRHMPFAADAYTEVYVDGGNLVDPAPLLEEPAAVLVDDPAAAEAGAEAARSVLLARLRRRREAGPLLRRGRALPSAARLQRLVEGAARADVARVVWRETTALRLLDPSCGTGSWLAGCLAALTAVAAACLQRLQAWVQDSSGTRRDRNGELHRLLARCGDLGTSGGRDRYARETVLLRCLYGVEANRTAAARARTLLVGQLDTGVAPAPGWDPVALADVRVGRLEEELFAMLEREAPARRGARRVLAGVAETESEALGRAWEQIIRVRLLAGAPAVEVAEGRGEIARRRERLYRLLQQGAERGPGSPHLHPQIEFDEVVRAGGFHLVRRAAPGVAGDGGGARG